jgi:hypothetical protein
MMASLPPPPITTTTALALIGLLAHALPWTRIRWWGEGSAVTCLIDHCQGCHHWRHLCLHSGDNSTKDGSHDDRQGRHVNIHSWEEVGHHDPIGVKQQKQKQKQNQQQWRQQHNLCTCRQLCLCCRCCCL